MNAAPSLTRDEIREVDRIAIEELGIPGVVLMENAGRGATEVAESLITSSTPRCSIVCGAGNNGGDGYVVARHLALAGREVLVHEAAPVERLTGDAKVMRDIAARMKLQLVPLRGPCDLAAAIAAWESADLVVDGLLGTGFRGTLRAEAAAVVEALSAVAGRVLALDLPSGLDADTGLAQGPCVRAAATVTFFAQKRGFDAPESRRWTGEVVVKGIGAPLELAGRARANVAAR